MSIGHTHSPVSSTQERALLIALSLTSIFLLIELVGGFLADSLALISDAAHMFTDVTALAISFVALKIGRRPADRYRTYGYYRFEILAAVFNTLLLFLVALYIVYEAYQRLNQPVAIHSMSMMVIACLGLMVNMISMRLLSSRKHTSLNLKSAYLEVWSDMLGSVGVILGALIIYTMGWLWVDSIVAILIGLWVLPRTFILLKESINILLEGVPKEVNFDELHTSMCRIEGILDVHELHVWAISSDKISLTAHIVIDSKYDGAQVGDHVRQLLASQFHISHTTLQYESSTCLDAESSCHFQNPLH
ncbi:MAG: cation transporter [Legionella sp.]|nr:MAG: cation transporter [Legionella sp.]